MNNICNALSDEQTERLIYIIQLYLYNKKSKIEPQRRNLKWFTKKGIGESWLEFKDILSSNEELFKFMANNNLIEKTKHMNLTNICIHCKEKETRFVSIAYGYKNYCGPSCQVKATVDIEKMKATKLRKYGDENYNNPKKNKETRDKWTPEQKAEYSRNLSNGLKNISEEKRIEIREKIKKNRLKVQEDGLNSYQRTVKKIKEKNIELYGVEWNSSRKEVQKKKEETFLKKYGAKTILVTPEAIEKQLKSRLVPDENGLNFYQRKHIKNLNDIDENGLNFYQRKHIKNLNDIDENGNNAYDRAHLFRLNDIDENGNNAYDRALLSRYENGTAVRPEDKDDFEHYLQKVRKVTRNQPLHLLENIEKRGKSKESYHLDHKYSIFQGFKDNIPVHIIGNIKNLEMINSRVNMSKNIKCSISLEELKELF